MEDGLQRLQEMLDKKARMTGFARHQAVRQLEDLEEERQLEGGEVEVSDLPSSLRSYQQARMDCSKAFDMYLASQEKLEKTQALLLRALDVEVPEVLEMVRVAFTAENGR